MKVFSSKSEQPLTFDACLSTPTLPAINAGAAKRITCQNGKFQGMTANMVPVGWNDTRLFRLSVFMVWSARNFSAFSAKYKQPSAHFSTSARASDNTLPISRVIIRAYCSLFCFNSLETFPISSLLRANEVLLQSLKADEDLRNFS